MKCPYCSHLETHVKDSRPGDDHTTIRRRRHCPKCELRFTTFERVQLRELSVIKRNGEQKPFDRDKVARSVDIALRKRPVTKDDKERAVNDIVRTLETGGETEIACEVIGELVMSTLKQLDQVGYIRYASVYRDFREAGDFEKFMEDMSDSPT